jgi:DNA-binding NtrC family response regulator
MTPSAAPSGLASSSSIGDPPGGGETILLIDDDDIVRNTTRRMLEYKGYQVLEGVNGRDGLEVYQRERENIGLVFLDLQMPDISGQEVLAQLRTTDPQVKVAYLSGSAQGEVDLEHVYAFVHKPFTFTSLLQMTRRILDCNSLEEAKRCGL